MTLLSTRWHPGSSKHTGRQMAAAICVTRFEDDTNPQILVKTNLINVKNTSIEWCDDSVNPRPGCDGCPLWPTIPQIRNALSELLIAHCSGITISQMKAVMEKRLSKYTTASTVNKRREKVVKDVLRDLDLANNDQLFRAALTIIQELFRCYAGMLNLRYGGHTKGHPRLFERPVEFPGRMAKAAAASDLIGTIRANKPWLNWLPRLIFISDMGDIFSRGVRFEFLKEEIIEVVSTPKGQRHTWLWLTKRPGEMVRFWKWLRKQGIHWPVNLVPIASILNQAMIPGAEVLKEMDVLFRGLSVEPLWEPVQLPLNGIDWVIVGGESGPYAKPFRLDWARDIQAQCNMHGVAFCMKQLGQNPYEGCQSLKLNDRNGGDWSEWPDDLRVRQFPVGFYRGATSGAEAA